MFKSRVEYAQDRQCRLKNKSMYRLAHWPIWITVFFFAPGWTTYALLDHGIDWANGTWLLVVLLGTAVAGFAGRLPGMEKQPYILRFDEIRPNPMYRRFCYTFAWVAILSFAGLNLSGLIVAATTGQGYLREIYRYGYWPLCIGVLMLGALGFLPRAGRSTENEGTERRYFFSAVWAVTSAQILLLIVWKLGLPIDIANRMKLLVFLTGLLGVTSAAHLGLLPRTRPIIPGNHVLADSPDLNVS